jgi:hypothetical protein
MPKNESNSPSSEFILYTTEDGQSRVECRFENVSPLVSQLSWPHQPIEE